MNFGDADLLGEITDFRFTIPGKDHDALELMLRPEMLNKGMSFGTRRIAQSECRREPAVDDHDAFESTRHRRKVLGAGDVLRNEFAAAGDLNLVTGDRSSQSLTGRLTHMRGLLEVKAFRFRLLRGWLGPVDASSRARGLPPT